jgi:uncharacterized protein
VKNSLLDVIKHFFTNSRAVKFAYLFGSHSRGNAGPLSDVDLAIYLDNRMNLFSARLALLEDLGRQLKGQSCDLVVLNDAPLVLRYEIIRDGKVLKENKSRRIEFETRVLREYLDTEAIRSVHLSALKRSFQKEHHLGQ